MRGSKQPIPVGTPGSDAKHPARRMATPTPRVIAVGGPNSPELLSYRGGTPLEHICRLFGYRPTTYRVDNLNALRRTIKFIGAVVRLSKFDGDPLVVHISVDGNPSGLEIGPDKASWGQLILMVSDLLRDLKSYSPPVILVLSACGARENDLTGLLLERGQSTASMPDHLFLFVQRGPRWTDLILGWAHFYGEATGIFSAAGPDALAHGIRRLCSRMGRQGLGTPHYLPRNSTGRRFRPRP